MVLVVEFWRWKRGAVVDWTSALAWCVVLSRPLPRRWCSASSRPRWRVCRRSPSLVLITPLGPLLYRLAYRPLADASVLMLLDRLGRAAWRAGRPGPVVLRCRGLAHHAFLGSALRHRRHRRSAGQSLVVVGVTLLLVIAMFLFFGRSMVGKALRATAINRVGARLSGIPTELSGDLSFALAALIGAVSGLLIAPITTVYYDTGFLIGLKGFVAAIVGGLASYPLALGGALLVGQLEAFASFWASAYKEVLVFTLIIPVLWWRSLHSHHVEDEE
jgi:branched-chain amino acid transport system permease protein